MSDIHTTPANIPQTYEGMSRRRLLLGLSGALSAMALSGCAVLHGDGGGTYDGGGPGGPTYAEGNPNGATGIESNGASAEDMAASSDGVISAVGKVSQRAGVAFDGGVVQTFVANDESDNLSRDMSWEPLALTEAARLRVPTAIIFKPGDVTLSETGMTGKIQDIFSTLQQNGVSTDIFNAVGPLVAVCPEYVVGGPWTGNDALDYILNVNATINGVQAAYPGARATVLIDTNPNEMNELRPLIRDAVAANQLNVDQIQSVGIQSLPNGSQIDTSRKDASGNVDLTQFELFDTTAIQGLMQAFGKQNLWIQTGLPRQDSDGITYDLGQRKAIAQAYVAAIKELQLSGYTIDFVNLIMASNLDNEQRDYSVQPGEESLLKEFADGLSTLGVKLSGSV